LVCALAVAGLVAPRQAAAAGGAFVVDDVDVEAPGSCKVESWASFAKNPTNDFVGVISPACVVNIGRPVEINVDYQRSRADENWGTTLLLKGKTNLIPAELNKLGLAVVGGTTWDLLTKENTSGFVNVPATFDVTEALRIHLNAGWLYDRPTDLHWLTWGAAFHWEFVKSLALIAEVFGQTSHSVDPPSVANPRFQAGLRFKPIEPVDFDVIYGRNITGENADWITLGLNLRFEAAK
jgi:hypothetical protein